MALENGYMLLGGGVMLYVGAEWLVGGASGLALALRVPQLLVGLTVVAYSTSAPELIVSVEAAFAGNGDVALGNIIGSNFANLGLILGLSALVRPAAVHATLRRRELPVLVACTALLPLLLLDARVSVVDGALLVIGALAYTGWMIVAARRAPAEAGQCAPLAVEATEASGSPGSGASKIRLASMALAGLGVLLLGSHFFVSGALGLAREWGMSERVLGLTIVALGTSLPELVTCVVAAVKGHSDLAVGNVVGSNIFNVLLCLGGAALAGHIGAPLSTLIVDLAALFALTGLACLFLLTQRTLQRWEGGVLLGLYLAYLGALALP